MTERSSWNPGVRSALWGMLTGAPAAQALAVTVIGWTFCVPLTVSLIGWSGVCGALILLCLLTGVLLWARRELIDFGGSVSVTLIAFLGWAALSLLWSSNRADTFEGLLYTLGFVVLGVGLAVGRDTIQLVRATGTALRALLTVSVLVEIYSGILLNAPLESIGVAGLITEGGPIQGVFGTRNILAFASLIALITFLIESRTRSVRTVVTVYSVLIALLTLLLSGSPVMFFVAALVLAATILLYWLRQAPRGVRPRIQWAIIGGLVLIAIVLILNRAAILDGLNAASEFHVRSSLWPRIQDLGALREFEGWGWTGLWRSNTFPYNGISVGPFDTHTSALSSYLDVFLQLGIVGLALFIVLVGTALVRSWQLASNRRSVTYTWPALILVTVVVAGFGESFILTGAGLTLLVMGVTLASRSTGWLTRFRDTRRALPIPHE